jgi:flagellar biosynthesis protein FlhF
VRVKRYVVDEVPEALPIIRSELGKDAVILNTKEIYVGGFLGLFRKKKMEVIAAVETNPPEIGTGSRNVPPLARPAAAGKPAAATGLTQTAVRPQACSGSRLHGPRQPPSRPIRKKCRRPNRRPGTVKPLPNPRSVRQPESPSTRMPCWKKSGR